MLNIKIFYISENTLEIKFWHWNTYLEPQSQKPEVRHNLGFTIMSSFRITCTTEQNPYHQKTNKHKKKPNKTRQKLN